MAPILLLASQPRRTKYGFGAAVFSGSRTQHSSCAGPPAIFGLGPSFRVPAVFRVYFAYFAALQHGSGPVGCAVAIRVKRISGAPQAYQGGNTAAVWRPPGEMCGLENSATAGIIAIQVCEASIQLIVNIFFI